MPVKISVLLVNLNNLEYTKQCLDDLLNQDIVFNLRLVDQNSSETGTKEFFHDFFTKHSNGEFYGKIDYLEILNTGFNKPLNHLWNDYVKESSTEFICLLNNDVRISPNFLSSSISVLEKEPYVGFVNHVTNNLTYSSWSDSLEYVIMETPYRQGWDPTFRKSFYNQIPQNLNFFYGDDFIYSKLYESGYKGAYILNSPMIHFERSTTIEKGGQRDCSDDGGVFHTLNLEYKNLTFNEGLCRWKPEFNIITKKEISYDKESYITRDPNVEIWREHLNTNILNDYSSILTGVVADFGCNHGACTIIASENKNIKDQFQLLPFKEPSATLYQLMDYCVQSGQRFASTADMQVGDANQQAAVGTTIALLERGSRVMSAIHKRLYYAMRVEFKLLAKVIAEYLPPEYPYSVYNADRVIKALDFDDRVDILPIADQTIFSMSQRITLAQTQLQIAQSNPQMHR